MSANIYVILRKLLKAYVKKSEICDYVASCGGGTGGGSLGNRNVEVFNLAAIQTTFTLGAIPQHSSLIDVYLNGLLLAETFDYNVNSNVIEILPPSLKIGDRLVVKYW